MKKEEFVVSLDFAENNSFTIQNAVQSQHWANDQATIHPYVAYYRKNNKLKHNNFVIISEHDQHDSTAVHFFNSKLVAHVKKLHGSENVKKIISFPMEQVLNTRISSTLYMY